MTATKRVGWAADPGDPREWHVTLVPEVRPVPTFCGRELVDPTVIHGPEAGEGTICMTCAIAVKRLTNRSSDEEIPYRFLTTRVWEVERDGQRVRMNRTDALDAFADAALEERGEVLLLADGVVYQRAWIGPNKQLFHSTLRNDGSRVEVVGDGARASIGSLIAHRNI